jgi:ribosomal protein L40E
MTENDERARADEMERTLARTTAWAIPGVTVLAAIVVGAMFGVGPGILVLASGALVGVIALLWASLRTLGGDAPLPEGLVAAGSARHDVSNAEERKLRTLRALKDLEHEHAIGKIDDADYELISTRYREQAKAILRELDLQIEPMRARAEELAKKFLAKRGLGDGASDDTKDAGDEKADEPVAAKREPAPRLACPKCETSNEPDAAFCKKCGTRLGVEASDAAP